MSNSGEPPNAARALQQTVTGSAPARRARVPLSARDVQLYRLCEELSEGLVYLMVLFSPWAFGTTQHWAIWTMNAAGYALGLLLFTKLGIRRLKGYSPPRWDGAAMEPGAQAASPSRKRVARLTRALGWLTVALLGYCLLSALNARATYHAEAEGFEYHNCIPWLPHSLDSSRTWFAFWEYLGLACAFWAVRDWLLGKSAGEQRRARSESAPNLNLNPAPAPTPALDLTLTPNPAPARSGGERRRAKVEAASGGGAGAPLLPARLRRLLWLLAINGGLLAVEGIWQRLEGSGNLLFLVKPRVNPGAESQFGPYAYRSNAAQYFNLLWPVCLGFWLTLQRAAGPRRNVHHVLLFCGALMAACPIMSTSRGGAFVAVGIAALAAFFLVAMHFLFPAHRRESPRTSRWTVGLLVLFFGAALGLGFALGWKSLKPRMGQLQEGFAGREEMYDNARPMAEDYPVFGTGPGTFETVFQLYRISTATYWPAQLHNDWLETRITFGWVGSALVALAYLAVLGRWFASGGIHGGRRFVLLIWLAMAGCLVHARFDFPFQIYSIVFLFLLLCSILSVLSRHAWSGGMLE
jgi:hypothetical protein